MRQAVLGSTSEKPTQDERRTQLSLGGPVAVTKKRDRIRRSTRRSRGGESRRSAGVGGRGASGLRQIGRRVLLALAVILALGALGRGLYLTELTEDPDFAHPIVDAYYHDYWARAMATGSWAPPRLENDPEIQKHPYFRPPGYPYILSLIYRLTGPGYVGPRAVQMLFGLLNVILAFLLARRLFGDIAGLATAACMATYWGFVYFEGEFLEPVFTSLMSLWLVMALSAWSRAPSPRRMLHAALVLGALCLVRPNALAWLVVIVPWALWVLAGRDRRRIGFVSIAILIAGVVVAIAPVTVRNLVVGDDLVLVSSNGGVNLYIGNNDRADGLVRGTMPGVGKLDTSFDHLSLVSDIEAQTGRAMKHSEVSDYLTAKALDWMKRHPGRVAWLMWRKTLLFWGPAEPADNKDVAADRLDSPVLRSMPLSFPMAFASSIVGLAMFLLAARRRPAATSGDAGERERNEAVALILGLVVVWYASHVPFLVTARYRISIIPFLFVFTGLFVETMARLIAARDVRRAALWACALAAVLVPVSIDLANVGEPDMARWHYQRGGAYARSGRMDRAIDEYRTVLELEPDYAAVHIDLGSALAAVRRVPESIPHFRKAVEESPRNVAARFNLGLALEMTGNLEESRLHYRAALDVHPDDREIRERLEAVEAALASRD